MEFRLVKFGRKLHFSIERVQIVGGVNSKVSEDTHFLMWDFDEIPLELVERSLLHVQEMFGLPGITILSTGRKDCYHAYCFKSCSFVEARTIIAATPNVDLKYLAIGLMRGYFTLRFTNAGGFTFSTVGTLHSEILADLSYSEVNSFVQYTKPTRGVKHGESQGLRGL